MERITKVEAIESLFNGAKYVYYSADDRVEWLDENQQQPTEEEIQTEIQRLQKEYVDAEYQRLRKAEYDKLNQDEMRFDDMMNGTEIWKETILAIKAKYPKPE